MCDCKLKLSQCTESFAMPWATMPKRRRSQSKERQRMERLNKIEGVAFWVCVIGGLGLVWLFVRMVN